MSLISRKVASTALPINPIQSRILKEVFRLSCQKKVQLYIVGGFLRDALLGRCLHTVDIDFAIKQDAIYFARGLKKIIKAGFVVLDQEHGSCRLVKRLNETVYTFDFTDFRGRDIEEDLLRRDFSLNALALPLEVVIQKGPWKKELIDPASGVEAIKKRIICKVYPLAFEDDPIRILRAFSLACCLGFKIAKDTFDDIQKEVYKLSGQPGERIRDELFKILHQPRAYECILQMDEAGVLSVILPEIEQMRGVSQGPYHHLDIWRHSLQTLFCLEEFLRQFSRNPEYHNYLNAIVSNGHRRFALMKLAALLHDVGKPQARRRRGKKIVFRGHERIGALKTEEIAKRLHLSNPETDILKKIVFLHLRPGYLGDFKMPTARAIFRYFRDAADESVSTLVVSIADQRATRGRLTTESSRRQHERVCRSLIREYFCRQRQRPQERFLDGYDIMRIFKIEPSPTVGRILSGLEELQAIGKIKTKTEAIKEAQRLFRRLGRDK